MMKTCSICYQSLPQSQFYQKHGRCKKCVVVYNRQWRKDNPEKFKEQWKRRGQTAKRKIEQRRWRQSVKGKLSLKLGIKKYRQTVKGKMKHAAHCQRYRKTKRGRLLYRDSLNRFMKSEKGKLLRKAYAALRRTRKHNRIDKVTIGQWRNILTQYNHACAYCGKPDTKLTMDHYYPLALSGRHEAGNLVPACMSCNLRKGSKHPMVLF